MACSKSWFSVQSSANRQESSLPDHSAGESTDSCGTAQGQLEVDEKVPFLG